MALPKMVRHELPGLPTLVVLQVSVLEFGRCWVPWPDQSRNVGSCGYMFNSLGNSTDTNMDAFAVFSMMTEEEGDAGDRIANRLVAGMTWRANKVGA
jgi:hypothetical protein